jgi:hypothetical protein
MTQESFGPAGGSDQAGSVSTFGLNDQRLHSTEPAQIPLYCDPGPRRERRPCVTWRANGQPS